jgi:ribonuclease PH
MKRVDGRSPTELRPVRIQCNVLRGVPGSVIIETGCTRVLCTACVEDGVPEWRAGSGKGWVTAEYDMLPAATGQRRPRNRGGRIDGRTQEIQRLVGRCLRAVCEPAALGERSIWIDCDVLQADGGTRTAAITGAYVAFANAVEWCRRQGLLLGEPLAGQVAAVSVGRVNGRVLLDLCYEEDAAAEVDFNVAMTDRGRFVEVQGTAEGSPFSLADLNAMLRAATAGIRRVLAVQQAALRRGRRHIAAGG